MATCTSKRHFSWWHAHFGSIWAAPLQNALRALGSFCRRGSVLLHNRTLQRDTALCADMQGLRQLY